MFYTKRVIVEETDDITIRVLVCMIILIIIRVRAFSLVIWFKQIFEYFMGMIKNQVQIAAFKIRMRVHVCILTFSYTFSIIKNQYLMWWLSFIFHTKTYGGWTGTFIIQLLLPLQKYLCVNYHY